VVSKPHIDQTSAASAAPTWSAGIGGRPLGHSQYSVTTAATSLSNNATNAALIANASLVVIYCESAVTGARWRDDGVAAATNVGMPLPTGSSIAYSANLTQFSVAAWPSGTVVLDCAFYGYRTQPHDRVNSSERRQPAPRLLLSTHPRRGLGASGHPAFGSVNLTVPSAAHATTIVTAKAAYGVTQHGKAPLNYAIDPAIS
jgi:hypothetical protein